MGEEKSPLDRLLARQDFKPFSGPHAFRVLGLSKAKIKMPPIREEDVLKAVSSLGVVLETEVAMIVALQQVLCTRCGNCCRGRGSIRLKKEELQGVADYLHVEYKRLKNRMRAAPMGDGTFIVSQPCPLLHGNLCAAYPSRPGTCRGYPAGDLLASIGRSKQFDDCPIADELLAEVVVKRVLEEQMWREHPEELNALAEQKRGNLAKLSDLPQSERMKRLVEGYQRSIARGQGQ